MSLFPRISHFLCLAGALRTTATIAVTGVVALASFAASPGRAEPDMWCGPSWACEVVPGLPRTPNYFTAIAVSDSTLKWGASSGYSSRYEAERWALAKCREFASDCKVQMWGERRCIALATSKRDLTWGVDAGLYPETAQAKALAQCRAAGGKACV